MLRGCSTLGFEILQACCLNFFARSARGSQKLKSREVPSIFPNLKLFIFLLPSHASALTESLFDEYSVQMRWSGQVISSQAEITERL